MNNHSENLEKQAAEALLNEKYAEAFAFYNKAAKAYDKEGSLQKAVFCYTSAACCWIKKSGEQTFFNAATNYEQAAKRALKLKDFGYASLLFKYAAINYERERDFISFSDCFYLSKECQRKFLSYQLIGLNKAHSNKESLAGKGIRTTIKRFINWLYLSVSFIIWGHGEKPQRTFFCALTLVFVTAFLVNFGCLLKDGQIVKPDFFESLYFSIVTFTTLGYGDYSPIGWTKIVVMFEAFFGMFMLPLFFISLSRKYLRI